jgi:hypothetical protein
VAGFLTRALGLTDDGGGNLFVDDDNSIFELAIDRLGTAGITQGCNPPVNDRFCPDDFVSRGQMAAFLSRALGLTPIIPPPPTSSTSSTSPSSSSSSSSSSSTSTSMDSSTSTTEDDSSTSTTEDS